MNMHNFVIYDLEFTAWEDSVRTRWNSGKDKREIIQIGAVKVNGGTFEEMDSFNSFVKPIENPILSDFIVELTGITQEKLDTEGASFKEALVAFEKWREGLPAFAWGFDVKVLVENCKYYGITVPFDTKKFSNMKDVFRKYRIEPEGVNSGRAPELLGMTPTLRAHNALNDSRMILLALQALKEKEGRVSLDVVRV